MANVKFKLIIRVSARKNSPEEQAIVKLMKRKLKFSDLIRLNVIRLQNITKKELRK
jgi:hypothetical protein